MAIFQLQRIATTVMITTPFMVFRVTDNTESHNAIAIHYSFHSLTNNNTLSCLDGIEH